MQTKDFPRVEFLTSAARLDQLPTDQGREIAFAGRSNAGKSSALNAITGNKKLARTSKTPGRTQLINFFTIDNAHRLVDLPGYGYAQVSIAIKERWQKTLSQYLVERKSLCGLVLVMDIRHPFKEFDQHMLTWTIESKLPVHVLLTKADKLSRNEANKTLFQAYKQLAEYGDNLSIQLFSSLKHIGLEQARLQLLTWLGLV